ncbi:hypothetical protein ACFL3P_02725 [Pseudomonadota bacterium]
MMLFQQCAHIEMLYKRAMDVFVFFILVFLFLPVAYADTPDVKQEIIERDKVHSEASEPESDNQEWKLAEEQWDLVKQGEQLLAMPMMQQLVERWSLSLSSGQEQAIELRYPGGEEGELWVEELRDGLISLGIPSKYLFVVPGSGEADIIVLKLSKLEMYSGE